MIILSRSEVKKEMGFVPGELEYEFYIKEVDGNDTLYRPVKMTNLLKLLCNQK